ncbi:VOC family protein [Algicella marina]|uniref:VOC family protein n=1 Tax=Algicella marina TaxID=2683284 RepID=A0A6P1SXM3_9RHOB|nr:VOC family protein [Algicella marina]QHQ33749.1 VOC family protein [Algicella marina]
MLKIDHFVFACGELEQGRAWMEDALGLPPVGAGKHARMGTHNALWRVGDAYLEVIAIDTSAPGPDRPRWFGLDEASIRERTAVTPQMVTWVAATDNMDASRAAAPEAGPALYFTRDSLHWHLTVPDDGVPPMGGTFPALIEWPEGITSPAQSLPDQGIALTAFTLAGPPSLPQALARIGADHLPTRITESTIPALTISVESPTRGTVTLG